MAVQDELCDKAEESPVECQCWPGAAWRCLLLALGKEELETSWDASSCVSHISTQGFHVWQELGQRYTTAPHA